MQCAWLTPHLLTQTLRRHQRWIREEGGDLRGRIYLSTQGINAQYSGEAKTAHAYAEWVGRQPGFEVRTLFRQLSLNLRVCGAGSVEIYAALRRSQLQSLKQRQKHWLGAAGPELVDAGRGGAPVPETALEIPAQPGVPSGRDDSPASHRPPSELLRMPVQSCLPSL